MHVELLEFLRCVRPHEPSWLVASVDCIEERDILTGRLGCPACGTEYEIRDGVADLSLNAASGPPARTPTSPRGSAHAVPASSHLALRAAALLDLTTPGGFVLLAGSWSEAAFELVTLLDSVHILVLNPATQVASGYGVSIVLCPTDVPIRPGSTRGAALDASHSTPEWIAATTTSVRDRGRIVAHADAPVPGGVTILARDAHDWVAETNQTTASIVQIARSRPAPN